MFTEEFKIEAVKQITEQGYPVSEVSSRLGVSTNSLYAWVKRYQKPEPQRTLQERQAEVRLHSVDSSCPHGEAFSKASGLTPPR